MTINQGPPITTTIDLERGIEWVPPLKGGKPRVPVVAITVKGTLRIPKSLTKDLILVTDPEGRARVKIGLAAKALIIKFIPWDAEYDEEGHVAWLERHKDRKAYSYQVSSAGTRNALMKAGYTMPLKLRATVYPEQGIIHAKLPDKPGAGNTGRRKESAAGHYSW